jgi:cysteine synthase B
MELQGLVQRLSTPSRELLDRVGGTSLLEIRCLSRAGGRVLGKAEWENPGGSVKDRAVRGMLLEAERAGLLVPGRVLLDATSGNTGIALALLGGALGYSVEIVMPANASEGRRRIIRGLGADLVLTDPQEGPDGAIREARRRRDADRERYVYIDQYGNDDNWRAHYETTAEEIWEQTEGKVTHFVAGLGTSGTFMGTGRRLRELNPEIRLVSVQPDGPFHGLEGLKHMATALVPGFYDPGLADRDVGVRTEDAYAMVRCLARREGLLVGPSSGAAALVAEEVARENSGSVVVTVLCDNADRYLEESFWEPEGSSQGEGA